MTGYRLTRRGRLLLDWAGFLVIMGTVGFLGWIETGGMAG